MDFGEHTFFYETFRMFGVNKKKFKYRLKNNKFEIQEKALLLALEAVMRKDKDKVFDLLKNKTFSSVFLEGARLYLLGFTNNYFGMYKFAIEDLELSVEKLRDTPYEPFLIHSYLSLLVCHSNRKDKEEAIKYIHLIEKHEPDSPYQALSIAHALAVGLLAVNEHKKCEKIIKSVYEEQSEYLHIYEAGFCLTEFMLSLKQGDPDACAQALDRYKKLPGYVVKANYLYMKKMLDHIYKSAPLYVYRKDFENYPESYDQIETIRHLSVGNLEEAQKTWAMLQGHNPSLYGDNFHYRGDFCLFSLAIEKYKDALKVSEEIVELDEGLSPMEKLGLLYKNKSKSYTKEDLIQLIWNEEVSELTLQRLRQLVYRFNKSQTIKLVSYHEVYKVSA